MKHSLKSNRQSHWSRRVVVSCAAGFSLAVSAATPGVETFGFDTAGFDPNTISSTVVHLAAGGNPGGFIEFRKSLTPPVFDIGAVTARPDFTGNYAADGIRGVSVDLNFLTANIDAAWVRFRPDLVNNGWVHPLTVAFPVNVWNSYAVSFDPTWTDLEAQANGWLTDQQVNPLADPSPAFAVVMASVDFAEVRIRSIGSTLVGMDNFSLSSIPESSSVAAAGMALLALLTVAHRKTRTGK